jgi:putative transcriptional regulator
MSKKLSEQKLPKLEAGRNIWKEVLDSVREIKAGGGRRRAVASQTLVACARQKTGLSQNQFADILGVSKRTLEQWEQGRREPSGAAKTLIKIAIKSPKILKDINVSS